MRALDEFYARLQEPYQACYLALRDCIVAASSRISEEYKWGSPFFYLDGQMFCYLWTDKKRKQVYVCFAEGQAMQHPLLELGERKRMKAFYLYPDRDIPQQILNQMLQEALEIHYRKHAT